MGDVNLEIKLSNLDERVIKIEESGGGSGGDGYITSVSNDFNVVNKKLSLSNDITTKLSKVDTPDNLSVELAKKIDKPASATNGQVLTYNGTSNEWEAQDSKGGSITEPTDLEKGIIGGDEWVSGGNYTIGESVVIDENKLYLLVGDGGSITKPSTDTTHSIWEETSISALNSKVNSSISKLEEGQDYSKEIIIGKWFDGKPIYRKIIKAPMTDFIGSSTLQQINISHNIENIDKIVSYFSAGVMVKTNGFMYDLPYFIDGNIGTYCYSVEKTHIVFLNKAGWGSNYDIVFILDYTKVTD